MELSKRTVELLRYINQNPGVGLIMLLNVFNMDYEPRLNDLIDCELISDWKDKLKDTDSGNYLGAYVITNKGVAFLKDIDDDSRTERKNFIRRSIITPIIVAAITASSVDLLKWMLSLILK